jgi:hypothetical protein
VHNFFALLKETALGKTDSWAIKWYASLFLQNKLNVYPTLSFTNNIGNDGSGSHKEINYKNETLGHFIEMEPHTIHENKKYQKNLFYFRRKIKLNQKIKNLFKKIKIKIQKLNG